MVSKSGKGTKVTVRNAAALALAGELDADDIEAVKRELALVGFADLTEVLGYAEVEEFDGTKGEVRKRTVIEVKDPKSLPENVRRCISKITISNGGFMVQMFNKVEALKALGALHLATAGGGKAPPVGDASQGHVKPARLLGLALTGPTKAKADPAKKRKGGGS